MTESLAIQLPSHKLSLSHSEEVNPKHHIKHKTKKVQFTSKATIINYSPFQEDGLQSEANIPINDFRQLQIKDPITKWADTARMERLLSPIFDTCHRQTMFNRLHGHLMTKIQSDPPH